MHGYYQKNLKKWHKTLNSYMNYISYAEERQARQMSMQRQAAQQKSPLRSVWKKNDFER